MSNRNPNEQLLQLLEEAAEELVISERKFRILIENSIDMVTLASPDGKLLYASPGLTRVLGYTVEELIRIPAFELIHAEDIPGLVSYTEEIMNVPGASFFRRQRLLHKDGRWIWCEGTITNMLEEPGIKALVSNFRDITERRTACESLKQSEKKFRELFENAPESITILDIATMKFISWNTNALKLSKFTPEEMLTKGPADISPEFQSCGRRSDEKAAELITRALNGEKVMFEWLVINGQGKTFISEVRLALMENTGSPQVYASFTDITQRKQTEKRLLDQNRRLSEIAFLQSHQVRKPVASILGLVNLFNHEEPSDPLNALLLQKIEEATKAFDETIKEIVMKTSVGNF